MKKLILLLAFVGITANTDCFAKVCQVSCKDGKTFSNNCSREEAKQRCSSHGGTGMVVVKSVA